MPKKGSKKYQYGDIVSSFRCTNCEKIYTVIYKKKAFQTAAEKKIQHFCSHECSAMYQFHVRGNKNSESRDCAKYTELKSIVREREYCQICGKKEENPRKMHTHHLDDSDEKFFDPSNCLLLCASCHRSLHIMQRKRKIKELEKKNNHILKTIDLQLHRS